MWFYDSELHPKDADDWIANSENPDQTAQSVLWGSTLKEQSDKGLHCLSENLESPCLFYFQLIQAWANYKNSSTGQLSAITVFLIFAGSLSRIFTSVQETGDELVIAMYICSSFFNGILAGQIVYYSKVKPKSE